MNSNIINYIHKLNLCKNNNYNIINFKRFINIIICNNINNDRLFMLEDIYPLSILAINLNNFPKIRRVMLG